MHPNGQLPAYEWAFGDVNPPVHAWAAWQVYCIEGRQDREFLIRVFSKLLLNFSWWVNRKDADGSNLFEGGFLGMDNIGLFDRSAPLPPGLPAGTVRRHQLDGLLLPVDAADRARAGPGRHRLGRAGHQVPGALSRDRAGDVPHSAAWTSSLWNEQDGFCYDVLTLPDGGYQQLPVRSMVGLLPLLSVALAPDWVRTGLPDFTARLEWLSRHRPELTGSLVSSHGPGRQPPDPGVAGLRPLPAGAAPAAGSRGVPVTVRDPLAVGGLPGALQHRGRRPVGEHQLPARASRTAGCSAATPTGADRSGSR